MKNCHEQQEKGGLVFSLQLCPFRAITEIANSTPASSFPTVSGSFEPPILGGVAHIIFLRSPPITPQNGRTSKQMFYKNPLFGSFLRGKIIFIQPRSTLIALPGELKLALVLLNIIQCRMSLRTTFCDYRSSGTAPKLTPYNTLNYGI